VIRIRNINILNSKFETLFVQYPEDMRFASFELIERYRTDLTVKWSEVFREEVKVDISYIEIPKQVNVLNICNNVAKEMGISLKVLFGKSKQKEVVLGKMFAVNICLDAYIPVSHIEEHTPFKNRIYYYYKNKLADLRETEPKIDGHYKEVFDKVMKKLKE